jgi:Rod binding domain-containing protein
MAALGVPAFPAFGAQAQASLAAAAHGTQEQARAVAREFEAVFLSQLLEQMSAGIKTDGAFGGGPSEGIYRSFLNTAIADQVARLGGIGIADAVYREILRMQEAASHDPRAE